MSSFTPVIHSHLFTTIQPITAVWNHVTVNLGFTLPTYWWSFPVYSSSRKNWFHIHPRLERWRIFPSPSDVGGSFPVFPGVKGRAVLGHRSDSVSRRTRRRTWLVFMASSRPEFCPGTLWNYPERLALGSVDRTDILFLPLTSVWFLWEEEKKHETLRSRSRIWRRTRTPDELGSGWR